MQSRTGKVYITHAQDKPFVGAKVQDLIVTTENTLQSILIGPPSTVAPLQIKADNIVIGKDLIPSNPNTNLGTQSVPFANAHFSHEVRAARFIAEYDDADAEVVPSDKHMSFLKDKRTNYLYAGSPEWLMSIEPVGNLSYYYYKPVITSDSSGNVYVITSSSAESVKIVTSINSQQTEITSNNTFRGLLTSYDKNGVFRWSMKFEDSNYLEKHNISIDRYGYLYLTGLNDLSEIENSNGTTFTSTYGSILKIMSGNVIDSMKIGDEQNMIYVFQDELYVAGNNRNNTINLFGGSVVTPLESDFFIAKFDVSGILSWFARIETGNDPNYFLNINSFHIDSSGNALVSIYHNIYDSYTYTNMSGQSTAKVFTNTGYLSTLSKIDKEGNLLWVIGCTGSYPNIQNITTDENCNVYVYLITNSQNPSTLYDSSGTTHSVENQVLLKFSSQGSLIGHVKLVSWIGSIVCKNNALYIGGDYSSSTALYYTNGQQFNISHSTDNSDSFIAKYSLSLEPIYCIFVASPNGDYDICISVTNEREIYAVLISDGGTGSVSLIDSTGNVSTQHTRAAIPSANSFQIAKFSDNIAGFISDPSYKILPILVGPGWNGFRKTIVNTMSFPKTLLLRNGDDTVTEKTIEISPDGVQNLIWYNGKWYASGDVIVW